MEETKGELLGRTDVFVLDMDGTVYCGDRVIEGAPDFLKAVERCGKQYLFFTNNSSKPPQCHLDKLRNMGCEVGGGHILSSADVTIHYLREEYFGQSVYLVGTPELRGYFREAGIPLVEEKTKNRPDAVVISYDTTLTYEKLERACTFIRDGAAFLATHFDVNCPVPGGFLPDCGAICAAISLSTGKTPRYFGKPFQETVGMVLAYMKVSPSRTAFVGDRLCTDVAAGVNHGALGFLVLSGETRREDLAGATVRPDAIFASLKEMADCLDKQAGPKI